MVVDTHLDPSMKVYPNTPIRINIRARGAIACQTTLMSPFSHMAEMDQIIRRLSCFDQWPVGLPVLQIHWMNPKPKYTWSLVTWFGVGLDRGVTPRSQQGHLKVTGSLNQLQIGKNSLFLSVLLQFNSLEISMVVETHLYLSMEM